MKIYEQLGVRLTYHLGANTLDVEVKTPNGPGTKTRSAEYVRNTGVRGGNFSITLKNAFAIIYELTIEADWGRANGGMPRVASPSIQSPFAYGLAAKGSRSRAVVGCPTASSRHGTRLTENDTHTKRSDAGDRMKCLNGTGRHPCE